MPVTLDHFIKAATLNPEAGRLVVNDSQTDVVRSKRGFFGKQVDHLNTGNATSNRTNIEAFRTALADKYGEGLADEAIKLSGLKTRGEEGKSLRSNLILDTIIQADRLLRQTPPKCLEFRQRHQESMTMPIWQGSYLKGSIDVGVCLAMSIAWARDNVRDGNTLGERMHFTQGSALEPNKTQQTEMMRHFVPLKEAQAKFDGNPFDSPTRMDGPLNWVLQELNWTGVSTEMAPVKYQFINEDTSPGPQIAEKIASLGEGHYILSLAGKEESGGPEGHAIGVRKHSDGSYTIMDPNTGEFRLQDKKAMTDFMKDMSESIGFKDIFRGFSFVSVSVD